MDPAADAPADVVFLIDVDNTLLDNDRIISDLHDHLLKVIGRRSADRYWEGFEALRTQLGYADYLGALQRYRDQAPSDPMSSAGLLQLSAYLIEYPFAERMYPQALQVIRHLSRRGPTVVLSDGDVVFQPLKVQRSGIWHAVDGRVLIFVHKENMLDIVQQRFAARHYVMIDDKLRILSEMKARLGERVTTVFPRQGHYAVDPQEIARYPGVADVTVERIGELLDDPRDWLPTRAQG